MSEWVSRPLSHLRDRPLPEQGFPAGYAALIEHYDLATPTPRRLTVISTRHRTTSTPARLVLTPRHRPASSLGAQLVFALKWEGVDLATLAAPFKVVAPAEMADFIRATPTGAFARRMWFLYEWLTGRALDVPDPGKVRLAPVVEPEQQVALLEGRPSARHKVVDNLPGTRRFCPMVRWTPALEAAVAKGFDRRAREVIGRTSKDLIARAAASLLLRDSRSSFAIDVSLGGIPFEERPGGLAAPGAVTRPTASADAVGWWR